MLARLHPHPRDARIVFDEGPHVYYVDGKACPVSVTGLVHRYFEPFDADAIIPKMMRSPKWPSSPYYGMTAEQIKRQWADAGKEAAERGTRMHRSIEAFYNGESTEEYRADPEFVTFLTRFHADHPPDAVPGEPYRTEWEVFDEEHGVAGSVDMVFRDPGTGALAIYDWKRTKEIKKHNPYATGKGPLAGYPDCNFVHYSLQLNVYRHILETKYGVGRVEHLYLVAIHPNYDGEYRKYECLDLREEVRRIFATLHSGSV